MTRALAFVAAMLTVAGTAQAVDPPTLGTVAPFNGSGYPQSSQTMTFTPNYPSGTEWVELDVVMSTQGVTKNACCFVLLDYPTLSPVVYLFDDNALGWSPVRADSSDMQANSHCQIRNVHMSNVAGAVTLSVDVTFLNSWAGCTLHFWEQAVDNSPGQGANSGWWGIPDASFQVIGPNYGPPQLGTVSPSIGIGAANSSQILQFSTSDPNGWNAISEVDILISPNHANSGPVCFMVFFNYEGAVYLFADNGVDWSPVNLGDITGGASNNQCQVLGQGSSYTGAGSGGNLTLNLKFSENLLNANYFDEQVGDQLGNGSGWGTIAGSFTVKPGLTITTASLPNGVVGGVYSQAISLRSGDGVAPFSWTALGLPPGVSIAPGTCAGAPCGVLSGTPTSSGAFYPYVTVTDSSSTPASRIQTYYLSIVAPLVITTTSPLRLGEANVSYSTSLTASGGTAPLTWSLQAGNLPPGLTLASNGTLSGTNGGGTYGFTVKVTDSLGASASASLSVSIGYFTVPQNLTINVPAGSTSISFDYPVTSGAGYYNQGNQIILFTLAACSASLSPAQLSFGPGDANQAKTVRLTMTSPASCNIHATDGPLSAYGILTVVTAPLTYTITSSPPGRTVIVEGQTCVTPCPYSWPANQQKTLSVTQTPQPPGASGTQYRFLNWTDNGISYGGTSHPITTPASNATYVANFATQYYLTTSTAPANEGGISPASGWYDSGPVLITAGPYSGYQLLNFSGSLSGFTNPQLLALNAPATVTANFGPATVNISDMTVLPGTQGTSPAVNGLSSAVSVTSLPGLPSWAWSTSPPSIAAGTQFNLNIAVPGGTAANDYQVTANLSNGSASNRFNVHVRPFIIRDYSLPSPNLQQWGPATELNVPVSFPLGLHVNVAASAPTGVAVFPYPNSLLQSGSFDMRIVASDQATQGNQSVTLTFSCSGSPTCVGYTQAIQVPISITQAKSDAYFTLHTNLGLVGLDDYQLDMSQTGSIYGCSSPMTLRDCFRSMISNDLSNPHFNPGNYVGQGLTGIRFNIQAWWGDPLQGRNHGWDLSAYFDPTKGAAYCTAPGNTPGITPGCGTVGSPGAPNAQVDAFWVNFRQFLQDLRSYGIRYVYPLIGIDQFSWPGFTTKSNLTTSCTTGLGNHVYFYPWFPSGYVYDGPNDTGNFTVECGSEPYGYIRAKHTAEAGLFWPWENQPGARDGAYYKLLDKVFQAVQDAQLQMFEFVVHEETDILHFPVTARLIQDNDASGALVQDVYAGVCEVMSRHGFVGPNGQCLATYSTTIDDSPKVDLPDSTWTDCASYYGEPAMLIHQSSLMHAMAGDYFGLSANNLNAVNKDKSLDNPWHLECSLPITSDDAIAFRNKWGFAVSTLAAATGSLPAVMDVHASVFNSLDCAPNCTNQDNATPDSHIAKVFFNNLYTLATTTLTTINSTAAKGPMPLTAPYPILLGETIPVQTNSTCPASDGWGLRERDNATGAAQAEYDGFSFSDLYTSNLGSRFIFRPWHWLDADCISPAPISVPRPGLPNGPYRPYSSQ